MFILHHLAYRLVFILLINIAIIVAQPGVPALDENHQDTLGTDSFSNMTTTEVTSEVSTSLTINDNNTETTTGMQNSSSVMPSSVATSDSTVANLNAGLLMLTTSYLISL